jgi:hypothetical protein
MLASRCNPADLERPGSGTRRRPAESSLAVRRARPTRRNGPDHCPPIARRAQAGSRDRSRGRPTEGPATGFEILVTWRAVRVKKPGRRLNSRSRRDGSDSPTWKGCTPPIRDDYPELQGNSWAGRPVLTLSTSRSMTRPRPAPTVAPGMSQGRGPDDGRWPHLPSPRSSRRPSVTPDVGEHLPDNTSGPIGSHHHQSRSSPSADRIPNPRATRPGSASRFAWCGRISRRRAPP